MTPFAFFPVHQSPSEKGSSLIGENLFPWGRILFFRVDPFPEGSQGRNSLVL